MKLYTLTMVGIGPFVDREHVDFRLFDDAGIFLIHGQTGSGKSSLLDAIVFALYGDVAGTGDRRKDRLRSFYLDYPDRSHVELVFGARDGVYRVVRETDRVRPGSGSIAYGKTSLEEVFPEADGSFRHLRTISTAKKECESEVISLVGLSREQFTQTILLPQGRFAEFLSAKSDERRDILQSIFGTQRFEAYEARVISQAKDVAASAAHDSEVVTLTHHAARSAFEALCQAADQSVLLKASTDDEPHFPDKDSDSTDFTKVAALTRQWDRLLLEATKASKDQVEKLEDRARQAQKRAELFDRYEALSAKSANLAEQSAAFAALAERLANAQKVLPLVQPLADLERSWQRLRKSREMLSELPQKLSAYMTICDSTVANHLNDTILHSGNIEQIHTSISDLAAALQGTAIRLEPLVELEKGYASRAAELKKSQELIEEQRRILDQQRSELSSLPEQIEATEKLLLQAQKSAERLGDLQGTIQQLTARLTYARNATETSKKLENTQIQLRAALEEAAQLDSQARALRQQWLSDAAASLAAELIDGQACAVCGATEHPSPAQTTEGQESINRQDVEQAQELAIRADQHVDKLREQCREYDTQVREHLALAQGSVDELRFEVDQKSTEYEKCKADADQQDAYSQQLTRYQQRRTELSEAVLAAEKNLAATETQLQADHDALRKDQHTLDDARAHYDSVEQRHSEHLNAVHKLHSIGKDIDHYHGELTAWNTTCDSLTSLVSTVCEHSIVWNNAVWENLHSDMPQGSFLDAVLPTICDPASADVLRMVSVQSMSGKECNHATQELAQYEHSVQATRQELGSAKFAELTGKEHEDAALAQQRLDEAAQAHLTATSQHASFQAALHHYDTQIAEFFKRRTLLQERQSSAAPLLRLAQIAGADREANPSRIALRTWVLITLFKDVLVAANHHLQRMSSGRYELMHVVGTKGTSHHGLELRIVDHDVDVARDASTLSGGESFYCSLALALGLAEIVTGENGGIELGCMFIDEGFGSLDTHTLDNVMRIFHDLRSGGRLIGVISHVSEMLSHIPERIRIHKGKNGSHLRIEA